MPVDAVAHCEVHRPPRATGSGRGVRSSAAAEVQPRSRPAKARAARPPREEAVAPASVRLARAAADLRAQDPRLSFAESKRAALKADPALARELVAEANPNKATPPAVDAKLLAAWSAEYSRHVEALLDAGATRAEAVATLKACAPVTFERNLAAVNHGSMDPAGWHARFGHLL